jgi:predicted nucleic acid-binding protein
LNVVFVDTGVWFALLVAKDPNHQRTTEWFDTLSEQVITSDYVVDETLTLLMMRGERNKAMEFGTLVIVGSLAILHKISEDQFNRSWILFQKLSGAGLSFTDCLRATHEKQLDSSVIDVRHLREPFCFQGRSCEPIWPF